MTTLKRLHALPIALGLALASFATSEAHAEEESALVTSPSYDRMPDRNLAIGAILGDPTALDLKLRFDTHNAVQVRAGWTFADPYRDRVVLMADYVYHFPIFYSQTREAGLLTPYLGIGGKIGFSERPDPVTVGARVPLGLAFMIREIPIEVFLEVVPGVHVVPSVDALVDAGLGARFYF